MSIREAVERYVFDGDTLYLAGMTHLIPFSAGHEIIRQRRRDLTLARTAPDLIYDQMIAAGTAKKLIFGWSGNPGIGSLRGFRRAVEQGLPTPIEIEEYTHFGLTARLYAGAANLPFFPLKSNLGSHLPRFNKNIKFIKSPYTEEEISVVPPLKPDVTVIHAQRADEHGNTQVWGITTDLVEAAFASKQVIVSVEEVVEEEVVRRDPNRTIIPDFLVSAVVHEPWGAHPSYVQGYYNRDDDFYFEYDEISRTAGSLLRYLDTWVYGVRDREGYVKKMPKERLLKLKPKPWLSKPVDYGVYV